MKGLAQIIDLQCYQKNQKKIILLFWKVEHLLKDLELHIVISREIIISQIPLSSENDAKIGRFYCNKKRLQWIHLEWLM